MIEAHFDLIWRTLRRLGVSAADADDSAQQVFLVASRKLERIAPEAERGFLVGTALRVASDARRAQRRRRELDETAMPERVDDGTALDQRLDALRARALLDSMLEQMPIELAAVFVLFEIEELEAREIAAMLAIPIGTVASRLRRARAEIDARLERHRARWREK